MTVEFLTQPISATPGTDYTPVAGTLIFSPGEQFKLIEIPLLNDGSTESVKTFRVVLTNATEGVISETFGSATITLRDNDPGFSFDSSVYSFGETQGEVVLNVRRGSDGAGRISVDYAVDSDTATLGLDFLPVSGTLSFEPNEPMQAIRVPILADFLSETAERFRVVLSNPSAGASLGIPNVASVRVLDNDQGFSFPTSTFNASEGQAEIHLPVNRATDSTGEISVEYSVEAGSATPELDYTPVQGTLVFAPGEFSATIRVPILNDGLRETLETFRVLLSNPSAGTHLGTLSVATVRIENDDSGFRFPGGSGYSVSESDGKVFLSVDRGYGLPGESSVEYSVEPVTATADVDYTPVSGKLVFSAENYPATIEIPILNDRLREVVESFRVRLSNPSPGSSLGIPSVASVRIVDNDPGFTLSGFTASEGSGAVIGIYRGDEPVGEVSVEFTVEGDSATPGLDYTPESGRVTFLDTETYKEIHIPILDDTLQETAETFRVILSNPSAGNSIGSPSTMTVRIADNDPGFSFAAGSYSVLEASPEVSLGVYRGSNSTNAVRVDYVVEPNNASPELDYTPAGGTLFFAAGDSYKTISVPILNDMISEGSESFTVFLTNASAGAFLGGPNRVSVRIQDDDIGFVIECPADAPSCGYVLEDSGAVNVDVVLRGDFKFTSPISVDFAAEGVRATANVDFLAVSGTLTFAPGETRKTVSIPLINDGLFDPDETFRIVLRNPAGLTQVGPLPRLNITIQDNERGYWIESNTTDGRLLLPQGSGDVLINVQRLGDFNYSSSIDFRTSETGEQGSTASPGKNFVAAAGTITFGPGETNKPITLRLLESRRVRVVEQFFVELRNPTDGMATGDWMRWVEIPTNERNPLRVDPDFATAVRHAGENWRLLPDGRMVMATSLAFLTGEDGQGIVRLLPDGTLDPSFTLARVSGFSLLLALQTNGQVLVGGQPEFTINGSPIQRLARLNADGSLDSTFLPQLSQPSGTYATALAVQPDGKILVATGDSFLARLHPDGSPDATFQIISNAPVSRILLDNTGRVLISGNFSVVENQLRPGLARLLADGFLDRSFFADWEFGQIIRCEAEAEGTFLVTYYDHSGAWVLGRLSPEGRLDPTFQPDARLGSLAGSVVAYPAPGQKVLLSDQQFAGSAASGIVSRLNADGTLDDSFLAGTVTVTFMTDGGWGPPTYTITPDSGGDLLISGDIVTVNGTPIGGLGRLLLNEAPPPVTVDPGSAQLLETNAIVNLTVVRTGPTSGPYTVNWATENGTALAGLDFQHASGTVLFAPGQSTQPIPLQLLDNQRFDGFRTLRLRLTTPEGTVLPTATVTIANDDLGFAASHAFANGRYLINLTGQRSGTTYRLQRSTDLLYWEEWTTTRIPQVIDDPFVGGPRQFYRLVRD